ncbi:hypothetical protein AVEN_27479-1 [Araneus ventricosus]|uniref:Uncharacterized protein n=1 Tax=Araneus ventricosus TaxID=182803 RepID=A0A4Y2SVR9_ARAVE|nr:hypothetical protein AVEN_27479-1 [Araneus ventricosus]
MSLDQSPCPTVEEGGGTDSPMCPLSLMNDGPCILDFYSGKREGKLRGKEVKVKGKNSANAEEFFTQFISTVSVSWRKAKQEVAVRG